MVSPFLDPPFDPEQAPYTGDEQQVVSWMLDYYRWVFLRKVAGLTGEQTRMTTAKSDLHLLGLARHMVGVEQYWFGYVFLGGTDEFWHYDDPDDPDRDLHPEPHDTLQEAVDLLHQQIARSRQVAATTSWDTLAVRTRGDSAVNLRWIVVHLLEEYARHCGHADFLREAIDGQTGD